MGGTSDLKQDQQREVGALLEPMTGDHPWPPDVPMGGAGPWTRERARALTRVKPTLVVEIEANSSYSATGWRHIVKLIRSRPDLTPEEVDLA